MGNVVNFKRPDPWVSIQEWDERDGYVVLIDKTADTWIPVIAEYDGLNFIDPETGWVAIENPTHWTPVPDLPQS